MQQAPAQSFNLTDLTGDDVQAIMNGMNELPSKMSRVTMNKVEMQIIQQVQAQQLAQLAANDKAEKPGKDSDE